MPFLLISMMGRLPGPYRVYSHVDLWWITGLTQIAAVILGIACIIALFSASFTEQIVRISWTDLKKKGKDRK